MSQGNHKVANIYPRITDVIFSVLIGLSFRQYDWLLAPPVPCFKLAMVFFAYLLVVVSRVGYHKSISSKRYKGSKRFIIDLWILYMYFVLFSAPGTKDTPPSLVTMLCAQVGVFAGYLVWDLFKKIEYPDTSSSRILISIVCLLLTFVILFAFFLPIIANGDTYLGGSIRDWGFLMSQYVVMVLFWYLKLAF